MTKSDTKGIQANAALNNVKFISSGTQYVIYWAHKGAGNIRHIGYQDKKKKNMHKKWLKWKKLDKYAKERL